MLKKVFVFYGVLAGVILFFCATPSYIEGDDASTILYHLSGRNESIQQPYAKYNSGFDYILSFIDSKNESLLRNTAFYLSFITAFSLFFLFVFLIKEIITTLQIKIDYHFFYFLPFLLPELLFNTLIINASNISYFFALISLIFYLKAINTHTKNIFFIYFIISTISFGIAVPFRWSVIMMLPIFTSYSLLFLNEKFKNIIIYNFFHVLLSLIFGFTFLYITGYTLTDFLNIMLWGKKYAANVENSIQSIFAVGASFFTPMIIMLLFFGLFSFYKLKINFINKSTCLLIALIPFFIIGFHPSFKYLFPIFPIIIFIIYLGYIFFSTKYKSRFSIALIIACVLMWIFGIQITDNAYAFGQSFKCKNIKTLETDYKNINTPKKINLTLSSGTFMPTLEGGRPIYGYATVFLNQWKSFAIKQNQVIDSIADVLDNQNDIIILQDRDMAYLQVALSKKGYITKMPFLEYSKNLLHRDFNNGKKNIKLLVIKDEADRVAVANKYLNSNKKVIFRSSYTSLIKDIYSQDSNNKFFWDVYTLVNFKN